MKEPRGEDSNKKCNPIPLYMKLHILLLKSSVVRPSLRIVADKRRMYPTLISFDKMYHLKRFCYSCATSLSFQCARLKQAPLFLLVKLLYLIGEDKTRTPVKRFRVSRRVILRVSGMIHVWISFYLLRHTLSLGPLSLKRYQILDF